MGRGKRPVGPLTEAIAAELRAERGRAQITIRDLSARSGVPRTTLGSMLHGDADPAMQNLYDVCTVLGVGLQELIARAERSLPPGESVSLPIE